MSLSRRAGTAVLVLLALSTPLYCLDEEEQTLPILSTGLATLGFDGGQAALGYSISPRGPLFALQPIVARLGGDLRIGPLQQSHTLELLETQTVFGPGSSALTLGEEIVRLSQAPVPGTGGLHVPLDLLDIFYGETLGYSFEWQPEAQTLTAHRTTRRELTPIVQRVHIQGVTTVVLRFPVKPRYRIARGAGTVTVEMMGDRLIAPAVLPDSPDPLLRDLKITDERIRLYLAPGTRAEDYVLADPYRLVFDIHRGAPTEPTLPELTGARPPRRAGETLTIVLDPGHGGSDTGAIGRSGVTEKDLTLTIARSLRRTLLSRLPVKVVLTREQDLELPLDSRTAMANQHKADLFISLHINSAAGSTARGAETYFLSLKASDEQARLTAARENQAGGGDPLNDLELILWDLAQTHHLAESQRLAKLVQQELNTELGLADRGVKQAPLRVLRGAAMPAILVELGFLSNAAEERRLQQTEYRAQLNEALVRAIGRYKTSLTGGEQQAQEALR